MLAIPYLLLVLVLGDTVCKRYFPYVSLPHRIATGFIAGLLMSTWITYGGAAMFGDTAYPMLLGNIFFVIVAAIVIWLCSKKSVRAETALDTEKTRFVRADWITLVIFFCVAVVMMYGTFTMNEGNIRIAHHQSSDFGSTASIMQSFAIGHNFPTEYPHFTGERIRYHFLFYFQGGNLEYLGLSPASANNTLSILTLLAMLTLVMTLGSVLFASRVAGRIGAILFYFHGSLAFITYYYANGSLAAAWEKLGTLRDFLSSGLPYRGEDWGVWSQVVYLNQRHLVSSIAIFMIVIVFLAIRQRERAEAQAAARLAIAAAAETEAKAAAVSTADTESADAPEGGEIFENETAANETLTVDADTADPSDEEDILELDGPTASENEPAARADANLTTAAASPEEPDSTTSDDVSTPIPVAKPEVRGPRLPIPALDWARLAPYIFAGVLLGLMPMWNGAVFAGAAGVLALMFLLLPLRREMIAIAIASALVALPQVIFLKTGLSQPAAYSLFYFGYTINEPTIGKLLYYLLFTFGFKWIFILIALILGTRLQRLMIASFTALIVLATCFQFSEELLANHKFFNMWLVLMNVPVGFGVVKLWNVLPSPTAYLARAAVVVMMSFVTIGGFIDFMPIKNSFWVEYKFQGDRLVEWIRGNTDPRSIFLSFRYVNHGILVSGRRLFHGHPYYAWGAGYNVSERDTTYRKMFESRDINEVFRLLKENKIGYVAIDNQIRKGDFVKNINEKLFDAYFPIVFNDEEKKYDELKIYAVPETLGSPNPSVQLDTVPSVDPSATVNAFQGGEGSTYGKFSRPRGIAIDSKGNFYVADTGNARIQKFSADGTFIASLGKPGAGKGEMKEPNGIAIDEANNLYVTDGATHKLQKLDPSGQVLNEWTGPEPGFYGPRDIALGPNKHLYIVDQGRTRIVKFNPATEAFTSWGTAGTGEGQFRESTGITIGDKMLFVADNGNNRVQVFDLDGAFIRQWEVQPWERYVWNFPDIAYDESTQIVYVSNPWKDEILVFDTQGRPAGDVMKATNATSLSIAKTKSGASLLALGSGSSSIARLEIK